MDKNKIISSIILALGLAVAGFFPGYYYYQTATGLRSVTVKGLAEQNVRADLAIWNLKFVVSGNDLPQEQKLIENQAREIIKFLEAHGFSSSEINVGRIEIQDLNTDPYINRDEQKNRFILNHSLSIRTNQVDKVNQTVSQTNELIGKGIVFASQTASYFFTELNSIKPAMLEKATESARQAANEFAQNSGSRVGKIRKANQGFFEIQSLDDPNAYETSQINKKVRVVVTVDYFLED